MDPQNERSPRGHLIQAFHIKEKTLKAQRGFMTYPRPHNPQGKWQN